MPRLMLALLALLGLFFSGAAPAQTFPEFTDYVVDAANVLPPATKADLIARLASLQKDSGRQLVVATIPDLQGYTIEDYGYRLGRSWGVGGKQRNDGAILIVAPAERKVRIEVGYGLTPYITDTLSSVIINGQIVPRFKAGDMPGGIVAGTDALIEQLRLPANQAQDRARQATPAAARPEEDGFPAAGIFVLLVLAIVVLAMMRRRNGSGRIHRSGAGPVILWGPGLGGLGGGGWGGGSGGGLGGGGGGFGGGGGGSFGGGGASGGW